MWHYLKLSSIGLVLALGLLACNEKTPVSLGQNWEIYAVADDEEWQEVGTIIQETLEKPLVTPLTEKEYVVHRVLPEDLEKYLTMRNLLLISSLQPGTEMERILRRALSDDMYDKIAAEEEYLFVARNQWAREQFLVILAAPGIEALKRSIASYPDYLYELFEQNRNAKLRDLLFFRTHGRLEKHLKETYDWTIKIPYGYKIAREDTGHHFVQLQKSNPDRNILIHWIDDARQVAINETWLHEKVNWLASFYRDGYVTQGDYTISMRRLNDYDALSMVGLWQNETEGGPMRAYAFRDSESDRVYVIFANVFAPDRRKEPYLRELATIVETFKSFRTRGTAGT